MAYQYKDKTEELVDTDYLSNLINHLSTTINESPASLKKIKNPQGLIQSLEKLNNMIGLRTIKQSIAKQTAYLITKLQQNDFKMKMLNTVLMGEAGHGKTQLGIVLSEIWYHLGFLDSSANKQNVLLNKLMHIEPNMLEIYAILAVIVVTKIYTEIIQPMYEKYGVQFIVGVVLLLTIIVYMLMKNPGLFVESTDRPTIAITSRSDFIGSYLGTTDKKTEEVLRNNIGRVLFIDEAYSLYSGPQDLYGIEALTCINKFLSEHENEIVVIFAGYEDKLKETIFKAQKGLSRRCVWHFTIPPYTDKELFEIFKLQLKKERLEIAPRDFQKVYDLFMDNKDKFPYAGGDVEKLVFYCQLNKNSRMDDSDYINLKDFKIGIADLTVNNQKEVKDSMSDYLQKLREMTG